MQRITLSVFFVVLLASSSYGVEQATFVFSKTTKREVQSRVETPPTRFILARSWDNQCIADCGSEQGMCISYCNGNGSCIARCADAHGRCVSRCHR